MPVAQHLVSGEEAQENNSGDIIICDPHSLIPKITQIPGETTL